MEEKSEIQKNLELYKLHVEITDRISQRRGKANRLYGVGAFAFGSSVVQFVLLPQKNIFSDPNIVIMFGVFGCIFSASWLFVINAYHELTGTKIKNLSAIEKKINFPFYRKELMMFKISGNSRTGSFPILRKAEFFLPLIFFMLCFGAIFYGFNLRACSM